MAKRTMRPPERRRARDGAARECEVKDAGVGAHADAVGEVKAYAELGLALRHGLGDEDGYVHACRNGRPGA